MYGCGLNFFIKLAYNSLFLYKFAKTFIFMKNRECPYCHNTVSLRNCIKYIIRGTNYPTTCSHCGRQLWLKKEPLPFMYCVSAGFLMMYLPMQYFLYYCKMDFIDSTLCCIPFAVITEVGCSLVILHRIFFKK